jgi:hypothetical protein
MDVAMLRILSVLSIAAALAITPACSSSTELPASTFQHDPTVLSGKPFGDSPDFAQFLNKQKERQALLLADLRRTRTLKDLDDRAQAKLMLSPLKLRRMELNAMLKNLDGVPQFSDEQRKQIREELEDQAKTVNDSITALVSLK